MVPPSLILAGFLTPVSGIVQYVERSRSGVFKYSRGLHRQTLVLRQCVLTLN